MSVKFTIVIAMTLAILCPTIVNAQKETKAKSLGIFDSKQEYLDFIKTLKKETAGQPDLKPLIPMINDVALGKPIGTSSKGKSLASGMDLLANRKIREELEIVDDQYQELQRVKNEIQERAAKELSQLDLTDREGLTLKIRSIKESTEKELDDLLLPHQSKRLQQLATQSRLRKESLARMLTRDPVKSELKLSDEQAKKLVQTEKEIEAELEEKIEKLRAEAREKLLATLDRSQRNQVSKILGETFVFSANKKVDRQKDDRKKENRDKKDAKALKKLSGEIE